VKRGGEGTGCVWSHATYIHVYKRIYIYVYIYILCVYDSICTDIWAGELWRSVLRRAPQ